MPETILDEVPGSTTPAAKAAKTDANSAPGESRDAAIPLDFSSDEDTKSTHSSQVQLTKGMAQLRSFKHTVNGGDSRELHGKIQSLLKLIEPVSPVNKEFKNLFINAVSRWSSSSRRDDAAQILCEALCSWMKKNTFLLEREVLLTLEKHPRAHEKFAPVKPMLFTAASGWAVEEFNFNLDGADPLA